MTSLPNMEIFKLKTHIGSDGMLRLELPTDRTDSTIEVLIVFEAAETVPVDDMGYPIGYFERTYGSLGDTSLERGEQPPLDVREELE